MLGGRHDWYARSTYNPQTGAKNEQKITANSGRVGLVYQGEHGLSSYLSYSQSFEPVEGQDRYGKNFTPSTGRQYELGIQYEPKNQNARFTAAIFDLKKQNVLTTDPLNSSSEWYSVQVREVSSKGLELEANIAAKNLNITASYTLLNINTTKSINASDIGLCPQGIPRHSAALWLDTARPEKRD